MIKDNDTFTMHVTGKTATLEAVINDDNRVTEEVIDVASTLLKRAWAVDTVIVSPSGRDGSTLVVKPATDGAIR